jgi:hypothetical protein
MKRSALLFAAVAVATVMGAAPAPLPKPVLAVDRAGEATVLAVLNDYAISYEEATNDMAKGALRPGRARALCSRLPFIRVRGVVQDWIGTIETLSATGDGRGVLAVRIGPHATVQTTNNGFSESLSQLSTLLASRSPVTKAAMALEVGRKVQFSGVLFPSNTDCMLETSVTMDGSMRDPEYLFRFTDLKAAE